MEVSILQHAKDKSPRQVVIDELVSQMRSASWPEGYQPLAVFSAVVEGGLQKKNVRWLTGLSIARLGYRNEKLGMRNEKLADAQYYTIDGKRLSQLQRGLNIVRMSDGSVRKIIKL